MQDPSSSADSEFTYYVKYVRVRHESLKCKRMLMLTQMIHLAWKCDSVADDYAISLGPGDEFGFVGDEVIQRRVFSDNWNKEQDNFN